MKLKLLLFITGIIMVAGSIFILVIRTDDRKIRFAPPQNQLPAAISNYSKTFKLNPSPAIWAPSTNGNTN